MPNWATNTARFSGKEEIIELIVNAIDDKGNFDFNMIDAIPEELRRITASPEVISEKEYEALPDKEKWGIDNNRRYITQKEHDDFMRKYGAVDWYDWSVENWGTKWSACRTSILSKKEGEVIIEFETAWQEPSGIYETLSKKFGIDILAGVIYEDGDEFDVVFGDYEEFEKIFNVVEEKDYFDENDKENYYIRRYIELR